MRRRKGFNKPIFSCTYCGQPSASVDHCPPKLLFPIPRPNNLETVPACQSCNFGASADEEYFRTLLMLTEAGETEVGKKLKADKAGRTLEKNHALRNRMISNTTWQEVRTEGGIALGQQLTIRPEYGRLERVATKIAKGLYFKQFGERIEPDTQSLSRFLVSQHLFDVFEQNAMDMQFGPLRWAGIFDYKLARVHGKPQMALCIMRFYETAFFTVMFAPAIDLNKWSAEAEQVAAASKTVFIPEAFRRS